MIGHIGIRVKDFAVSKAFYEKALAPLGYKPLFGEDGVYFGFGVDKPDFWISVQPDKTVTTGAHIAFAVDSTELVGAFHAAALAAGGTDNGAPGLRPEYGPTYYGAFVHDPDGNNIEAVTHNV
jgi:catechol 2,3-dioxygenase-like lactoylglutathione lyase family enzyme